MVPRIDVPASATEQQWYYTRAELARPPSVREGSMSLEEERRRRQQGIRAIWTLRDALGLTQLVVTVAATLFQRYYMRESFTTHDHLTAAGAAVFLACKVEEQPKSSKLITHVLFEIRRGKVRGRWPGPNPPIPETSRPGFDDMRRKLTIVEEAMLNALCFDMTVRDPHYLIVLAAEKIWREDKEAREKLVGAAWSFLNDTLSAPLCILHPPPLLAAAALALACIQLSHPLPAVPPSLDEQRAQHADAAEEGEEAPEFEPEVFWLEMLGVEEGELKEAVQDICEVYTAAEDDFVVKQGALLAEEARTALLAFPFPVTSNPPVEDSATSAS
ncbi:hypothetical protein JCM8097_003766 [Rhodosporidiobolus ruineniae]